MLFKKFQYIIRLQRGGRIRRPFWRIVVQKKLYGINRAPIAVLGTFNSFHGFSRFKNYSEVNLKSKRIYRRFNIIFVNFSLLEYWLIKGAFCTERVAKILF